MRAKIFAALLGLSMVVPTLFTTTVKATEMEGVTVSDNEIEVTVCTDEVERMRLSLIQKQLWQKLKTVRS